MMKSCGKDFVNANASGSENLLRKSNLNVERLAQLSHDPGSVTGSSALPFIVTINTFEQLLTSANAKLVGVLLTEPHVKE